MKIWMIMLPLVANAACYEAVSIMGEPKYKPDDTLSYVSSEAKPGGTMRLASIGTFNHFDPMAVKGIGASGMALLYESLMTSVADDKYTVYPLIAQKVCVNEREKTLIWHISPSAKWHDGVSVTSQDIQYSYERAKNSDSLRLKRITEDINKVDVLDDHTLSMQMKDIRPGTIERVSGVPIMPSRYESLIAQNKVIGSGPYKLGDYKKGRHVHYIKNKDYWGKDLGVNRYRYSFDAISYEYFLSDHAAFKSFKAANLDYWQEAIARRWQEKYPAKSTNHWVRACYPTQREVQMQGFVLNLRNPLLQEPTLRLVLSQAMKFDWLNEAMFFNQYSRLKSVFTNTPYEAKNELSQAEISVAQSLPTKILLNELNQAHLQKKYDMAQLKQMLRDKGYYWHEKQLYDRNGRAIRLNLPYQGAFLQRVVLAYRAMLAEFGIDLNVQLLSAPDYLNMQRHHQYDLIWSAIYHNDVPGQELFLQLHSTQSNKPGLVNLSGLRNVNIDFLLEKNKAASVDQKAPYLQMIDRLLQREKIIIPHWYLGCNRVAHSKLLQHASSKYVVDDLWSWWYGS